MPLSKEGDAARKRGTRSGTAQVAAQQRRTVQDAVFPTSDADRKRFKRQQAKEARERIAAKATAAISAEAAAAAEDGIADQSFPTRGRRRSREGNTARKRLTRERERAHSAAAQHKRTVQDKLDVLVIVPKCRAVRLQLYPRRLRLLTTRSSEPQVLTSNQPFLVTAPQSAHPSALPLCPSTAE